MTRLLRPFALLTSLAIGGCLHATEPSAEQMATDVQALHSSFAILEELQVQGFRNQDWCRFIDYPRGGFTNLPDDVNGTCNLFDGEPIDFDEQATADFARVRAALEGTGVRGDGVFYIEYDDAGRLVGAQFDLNGGDFDRWSYIYEPGAPLPDDIEGEEIYTRINDDWYFWWEDWN